MELNGTGTGLNVLFSSDGINRNSGFATVARNTCLNLKNMGYNVFSQDWNLQRGKSMHLGIPILPGGKHIDNDRRTHHGFGLLFHHLKENNIDALITLGDIDMNWYMAQKKTKAKKMFYIPVDSDYVPTYLIDNVNKFEIPVAMSNFGKETLNKCGAEVEHVIYHGIDSLIYNDNSKSFRHHVKTSATGREIPTWEDKFIAINVDTNTPRKRQAELIQAWSIFAEDKDDVILYIHTDPRTPRSGGYGFFDLYEILRYFGLKDKGKVFFPDFRNKAMFNDFYLAALYKTADCFVSANTGEGYGLTKHEAMACGTPCIVPKYAASVEMVGGRGLLAECAKWSNGKDLRLMDTTSQTRAIVDVYDLADKIQTYYDDRKLLANHSEKAYNWAHERTWESETKKWANLINEYCS
jgi:glycosyltransferase involved in cell wall biosynthesis